MIARGVSREAVFHVIFAGEVIEHYGDDFPLPSCLLMGWWGDRPLHVVAALDAVEGLAYIVTVYEPDAEHFEDDLRTRRRN